MKIRQLLRWGSSLAALTQLAAADLAILDLQIDPQSAIVRIPAQSSAYYLLLRGDDLSNLQSVTDARLGVNGPLELVDRLDQPAASTRFYRVAQLPLTSPRDLDRDGLDDVYELSRPPFLDPFNPEDGPLDPDRDGLTNLQEYRGQTDPFVSNLPPAPAAPRFQPVPDATGGVLLDLMGTAPADTYIRVEGGAALATNRVAANGTFALTVPLGQNRVNRLFLTAVNAAGTTSPGQPLEVLQDSQPPTVFLDFPTATQGQVVQVDQTLVSGRVGDALSGYRGLHVWVHSSPSEGAVPTATAQFPTNSPLHATVDVGIGPNGTFHRTRVPLAEGVNTLTVLAADLLGNRTFRQLEVIRQPLTGPRLLALAGDEQATNVLRRLATPLRVRAVQPNGSPVPDSVVTFSVTRSDGRLLPGDPTRLATDWTRDPSAQTNGAQRVSMRTDALGEASVNWTLGSDAGSANQRVEVSGAGLGNEVFFCATALPSPARQINVGSGHPQIIESGTPVTEPLRAWVSDGLNPVPGTPVVFRVVQGGGRLTPGGRDGTPDAAPGTLADTLTVLTGFTGHASVGFVAGPDAGDNLVEAAFDGQVGQPAIFRIRGVARMAGHPGRFSGVVLDNASQPIGHAYCELEVAQYKVGGFSDAQGRFEFLQVPGGMGHLRVNGATANQLDSTPIPTNSFPALSYGVVTVANAENSLPSPVLLPRLNPANAQLYDGTHDLAVTCAGLPGLRFLIRSNSMHHADGVRVTPERPALVSVNPVHHDKIPMPMPDGVAPSLAWTLQPGGATFDADKPVQIEYPNLSGLAPGSIAYFLSFNHDTERFEIVSSGHVTADGAQIVTDPNSGLTVAGWGCNCPPYSISGGAQQCQHPTPSANGCGAAAMGGGNRFTNCGLILPPLPQVGLPIPFCFTLPCDNHDRCWGTCNAGKSQCDIQFLVEMYAVCNQVAANNPVGFAICEARAFALYQMVTIFGGPLAYAPAQAAACVCLNSAPFPQRNRFARPATDDVAPYQDLDGDLLPDEWESSVGLDPTDPSDTLGDPDSDGLSNFVEFFLQLEPFSADSDSDGIADAVEAEEISPALGRTTGLDPTWLVQIAGQTVQADVLGNFRLDNLTVPDVFGAEPGDPPDLISDDLVRVTAVSTAGGTNRYATSPFFRLYQGQVVATPPLTFSTIPPQLPESLELVADANVLTQIGATTRLHAVIRFGDGTTGELNSPAGGTTFRVSNAGVVSVDAEGRVTAVRAGRAILTASNQGAVGTCLIDVIPGATTTTVLRGLVRLQDGSPAVGVRVTVTGQAFPGVETGPDGNFEFPAVPTVLAPFDVIARITGPSGRQSATRVGLLPGPTGVLEAGTLTLAPVPPVPRFLGSGQYHALATRRDGSLWAWGVNDDGQLGLGHRNPTPTPTQVGTSLRWRALATGPRHNLALQDDGSLWVWGHGFFGQLGLGTTADQVVPTRLGSANDWTAIAAGEDFSLALKSDGTLWVWGSNDFGQHGTDTPLQRAAPVQVLPGTVWIAVAAGRDHVLAVRADGTLWSWGANTGGQLGTGNFTPRTAPGQVGSASDWESVSAAGDSSFALRRDGSLWTWGINSAGQLGLGDQLLRNSPTRSGVDTDWWSVTSSGFHTVALKLDGSVWGMGGNDAGELFDGLPARVAIAQRLTPGGGWRGAFAGVFSALTLLVDDTGALQTRGQNYYGQLGIGYVGDLDLVPARVIGDGWLAAGAGNFRSAGIRASAAPSGAVAEAWGNAPVGDGSFDRRTFPTPVALPVAPANVSVGSHFQVIGTDGSLWGWGDNNQGQVGNGTSRTQVLAPVRIGQRTDWRQVEVSSSHSLGLAADGSLWAWGGFASGALGTGQDTDALTPVAVTALGNTVRQAAAGETFSLALRTDGTLWGWGGNFEAQLGDNTFNDRPLPAQVGTAANWQTVSAGATHVLAVQTDGSLWGWGRNREGQLGDGTTTSRREPTLNPKLTAVRAVEAGFEHSLAIRLDGTLWAWGRNTHGQVGDGTRTLRNEPVQLGTDTDWVAIWAGTYHSLARKADGSLWGWGDHEFGETGTSRTHAVGSATNWGPANP